MLYLKKITKYDIPESQQVGGTRTSTRPVSTSVYISQRETLESIAGAYTLDILNSGDIAAVLVDCPKAIQDTPRVRHILRHEEAYIVNESGETITTINGRKNVSVSGHSLTIGAEALDSKGGFYLSEALGEHNRGQSVTVKLKVADDANVSDVVSSVRDEHHSGGNSLRALHSTVVHEWLK